jgi:hypothetical protein
MSSHVSVPLWLVQVQDDAAATHRPTGQVGQLLQGVAEIERDKHKTKKEKEHKLKGAENLAE